MSSEQPTENQPTTTAPKEKKTKYTLFGLPGFELDDDMAQLLNNFKFD
jgi:hypothetical protein